MPHKKTSFAFYIGMVVSLVFIIYAVLEMDLQKAADAFLSIKPLWFIPVVVLQILVFYFRALRWRYIMEPIKRVPTMSLFSNIIIGFMGNMIFPMRIGEIIRIYLIAKKERIPRSGALATIVLERIFDFMGMIALLFGVMIFASPTNVSVEIWQDLRVAGGVMVIGLISVFTVFYFMADDESVLNRFFNALVKKLLPERLAGKLVEFFESFRSGLTVLKKEKHLFAILVYNAAVWICIVAGHCLYLPMFGMPFSLEIGAVMALFVIFGVMVPSSPAFIGPFHAAIVLSLGFYGVDAGKALGIAVLIHVANFIYTVAIGLFFLSREKMTLSEIRHSAN